MDAPANWMNYVRETLTLQPSYLLGFFLRPGHVQATIDSSHV